MFIPVAEGIARTFGKNCETAIHDLSNPDASLVYVAGDVTSRQIGAPITNIVLKELRNHGQNSRDMIGYKNTTGDGRTLKSSTIFIRDNDRNIIGCLCINFDVSSLLYAAANVNGLINDLVGLEQNDAGDGDGDEFFAKDVTEALENITRQTILKSGLKVAEMQKEDKVRVVMELDKRGVFLIKGAVDRLAATLGVSRYTIYNYLEEGRAMVDRIS